jgi:hypothetical protein
MFIPTFVPGTESTPKTLKKYGFSITPSLLTLDNPIISSVYTHFGPRHRVVTTFGPEV